MFPHERERGTWSGGNRPPQPGGGEGGALPLLAAGLFRLNAKLPIPFDGWSEMEADLSASALKLVIEIDGPQHLSDPAAYRRDRRKDALLQENGCHVLRFLAEDLSKHLDATLDAIHRAIAHLRRTRQAESK